MIARAVNEIKFNVEIVQIFIHKKILGWRNVLSSTTPSGVQFKLSKAERRDSWLIFIFKEDLDVRFRSQFVHS